MRFVAPALISILLILCCRDIRAAEPGSSWWPFSHHDITTPTPPTPNGLTAAGAPVPMTPPSAAGPVQHEVLLPQSSADVASAAKGDSSWFHMPHWMSPKSPAQKKAEAARNAWATKAPAPKTRPSSVTQSMKNGAHSIAEGTKSAYHKTVAALTPGEKTKKKPNPYVAKSDTPPSVWKRMFGAKQPETQPPTVQGFLAQKRLDP